MYFYSRVYVKGEVLLVYHQISICVREFNSHELESYTCSRVYSCYGETRSCLDTRILLSDIFVLNSYASSSRAAAEAICTPWYWCSVHLIFRHLTFVRYRSRCNTILYCTHDTTNKSINTNNKVIRKNNQLGMLKCRSRLCERFLTSIKYIYILT